LKQAHYDLVILGSGSTAFAAALRVQALGKTSVMTEERTTGGGRSARRRASLLVQRTLGQKNVSQAKVHFSSFQPYVVSSPSLW